jgi:L-asparaginase
MHDAASDRVKVALLSTGGTIAMSGRHPYDWVDYAESGIIATPAEMLDALGPLLPDVDVESVQVQRIGSTGITPADWYALATTTRLLLARHDVDGVVITHGTATLEETAWYLALVLETEKPVVIVGAQRPPNTAGSDAAPNLRAALLLAASESARGCGVVVAMDGRFYDARSVTKQSNHDLDAFTSADSGALGRIASDGRITMRVRPLPLPQRPWREHDLRVLPRVDIVYGYAGADGTATRAFVAAGAHGIVSAGLPPGRPANAERIALAEAAHGGVAVVLASRALRGSVEPASDAQRDGFLSGTDLSPQKTRILLMLALTATRERAALQAILDAF